MVNLKLIWFSLVYALCASRDSFDDLFRKAVLALDKEDYDTSIEFLAKALSLNNGDAEANQLIGTLYTKLGDYKSGSKHLRLSLEFNNWKSSSQVIANYIEALRGYGDLDEACKIGAKFTTIYPDGDPLLYYNYAYVEEQRGNANRAFTLYQDVIRLQPSYYNAWWNSAHILEMVPGAEKELQAYIRRALVHFPDSFEFYNLLGVSFQVQQRFEEAIQMFLKVLELNSDDYKAKSHLAASYHLLGVAGIALDWYEKAKPFAPSDAGIRNNYGALLGTMDRKEEEVYWMKEALQIEPNMTHAMINLAGYYQDEGLLEEAQRYLSMAMNSSTPEKTLIKVRMASMLYPVCDSWSQMIRQRNQVEADISLLVQEAKLKGLERNDLGSSLDRLHFYVQYHGLNDRPFQEMMVSAYHASINNLEYRSLHLQNTDVSLTAVRSQVRRRHSVSTTRELHVPQRKVRVGFLSKFFGIFEPHGLLLDGTMRYLPRSQFTVIALPIARTDLKPLAPSVLEACDFVHEVSLSHDHAAALIASLDLDVLVFADTMSEPMTHFMAHSRLARIQVAFWGNPLTSASTHIDYFVSADVMEHPFRSRMKTHDEPYTEQVVLLDGQGIWYYRPEPVKVTLDKAKFTMPLEPGRIYSRSDFDFQDDWFLYFCPQSVFKMHPLFDAVFARILDSNPKGHLVITGGRKPRWTNIYMDRLNRALGNDTKTRLHMISRVSSEKFLALLEIADVILHPFPFDGSRTSADGLTVGVPVLTLPTEYLRGRMGASFLRTMNIPELVARSVDEYVSIAVDLWRDKALYTRIRQRIRDTVDLIWEDLETPFGWTQFLSTAAGLPSPSWESFLRNSGRDYDAEMSRRQQRRVNIAAFDRKWGSETWLLCNGVAVLESHLEENQVPRIFNNWGGTCFTPNLEVIKHVRASVGIDKNTLSLARRKDALIINEIRSLMKANRLDDSYSVAQTILHRHKDDPLFMLELGAIQFFRSQYESAYSHCIAAAELLPSYFIAYACVAASAVYIDKEEEVVATYRILWDMVGQEAANDPFFTSSVFTITQQALEFNWIMALNAFKRHDECVSTFAAIAGLPEMTQGGGAYILLFSVVDWSPDAIPRVKDFGDFLISRGLLSLTPGRSFLGEITRVQADFGHILNPAVHDLMEILDSVDRKAMLTQFMQLVSAGEGGRKNETMRWEDAMTKASVYDRNDIHAREKYLKSGFVLLLQYYNAASNITAADMRYALQENLNNAAIAQVILLNEQQLDFSGFDNAWKIRQFVIAERLTFKTAFEFADIYLRDQTVIIANADIYFDESLFRIGNVSTLKMNREVMALMKWTREDGGIAMHLRADSQDAWIFQPPINHSVAAAADFYFGLPRCDNRLAYILAEAGHAVYNPAFAIHAIEVQNKGRGGALYDTKGSVVGNVRDVLLSDRHVF